MDAYVRACVKCDELAQHRVLVRLNPWFKRTIVQDDIYIHIHGSFKSVGVMLAVKKIITYI